MAKFARLIAAFATLGVAIAAVVPGQAAFARDSYRDNYGYWDGYRRGGYHVAVETCTDRADRYSRGRVRVLDVDRRGDNRFRVRGIIERRSGDWHYRYDRHGSRSFSCSARGNGRITSFKLGGRHHY